eukprot:TRINITY_DN9312_c0_g2_i1.p1 TRINITY_DN9312_c0_g2~~TRINITY_DN9312_c0_g2_i1.p1  ORF type:complete len:331 (+),score=44.87 TRINITY_DN9312_c0_g2_i1:133-1125(+)
MCIRDRLGFECWNHQVVGADSAPEMTRGKQLKPGQWTDDTSMALCLADSLLTGEYNGTDLRVRFWNWWHRGLNNGLRNDSDRTSRRSIGLGMNIGKSLDAITDCNPPPRYDVPTEDSGNGSLMRLAAVPIAFSTDLAMCMAVSAESSRTTHPGHCAAEACRFLGFLLWHGINRTEGRRDDIKGFIDGAVGEYLECHVTPDDIELRALLQCEGTAKEACWNWRGEFLNIETTIRAREADGKYNGYDVSRAYFGSYCMDGLAMALHSAYHSVDFGSAVARCVNFLGDADSTAAICGQIAGASVSYTHLRAHETVLDLVCRLLLEKKKECWIL